MSQHHHADPTICDVTASPDPSCCMTEEGVVAPSSLSCTFGTLETVENDSFQLAVGPKSLVVQTVEGREYKSHCSE